MGFKIIDRYIGREYLYAFALILGLIGLLIGLNVFFEKFDDIATFHPAISTVFLYLFFRIPTDLIGLTPLVALLAVLFGIGLMSKNNEVLAMHSCGISYTRLGLSIFVCSLFLSIVFMGAQELVLPRCAILQKWYEDRIKDPNEKLPQEQTQRNVYKPGHEWVFYMSGFDTKKHEMTDPVIVNLGNKGQRPVWKVTGQSAKLEIYGKDRDTWVVRNAQIWQYNPATGDIQGEVRYKPVHRVNLAKNLTEYLGPQKKPDQMNALELFQLIQTLQDNGENTRQYSTDLQKKLAFPFSILLLTLIGFTIAVRAHVRPLVVGFSYGLGFGIAYYLLDAASSNFGHNGLLPGWLAGWLPNVVFLFIAIYRINYMNQVRD